MWIYLNNRFVSKEEAKISVFDHGFLYGDGVFETLRSYGGKVFMLSEHIARLEQSAARLHIPMPVKRSRLSAIVAESSGGGDRRDNQQCVRGPWRPPSDAGF